MTKQTLKERLLAYFKKHHTEWIPSGEIQRLVAHHTTYSPANVTRRLRELREAGQLDVKIEKGHAHYRLNTAPTLVDLWNERERLEQQVA